MTKKATTYEAAGVNIVAGTEAVELMKEHVKKTHRPEVLGDLGGFGGFFALNKDKYEEPILVSGTDGVGTKLKIAFMLDKHDTIGIDAVAMCVNDILVQGAEPLFFLDYLAVGKLSPEKVANIVKGIAEGCQQAGCALVGGETAEMPGFYQSGEYDVAGFSVGIVDKKKAITGQNIKSGDKIIGLASSGIHSNGYSLVRKVLLEDNKLDLNIKVDGLDSTLGEALLTPTKIYVKPILKVLAEKEIKGMAHITGGGLTENIPRILPEDVNAKINIGSWPVLPIFKKIQELGNVPEKEMYRTFNMGIGMTLIVEEKDEESIIRLLEAEGETVYKLGEIVSGTRCVEYNA